MSHEATGHVFGIRLPANEKWLLVCLANYADSWGDSVFPSLDELEDKTGMSRATLKRTFAKLINGGYVERVADSTPVSPPFYRIVGVPEPVNDRRPTSCPVALRRAVLFSFDGRCEYCGRTGTREIDPDDKPWNVDRVVPASRGGGYNADNVTLACRSCNSYKRAKAASDVTHDPVRTLADLQASKRRVQNAPSHQTAGAAQIEPSPGLILIEGRGRPEPSPGFTVNPDPLVDPSKDPLAEVVQAGAAPRPAPETADANIAVITKIAHESIDLCGAEDLAEVVKSRCASLRIAYDSGVVRKAIESAQWQRAHRRHAGA